MQKRDFWLIMSLSALAGGIAAILYAPGSGASTRKKLKRGLEDLSENLEDASEYLKEQAERLSKEAQKLLEASRGQIDQAVDTASGYAKTANKASKRLIR